MKPRNTCVFFLSTLLGLAHSSHAQDRAALHPLTNLGSNTIDSFAGTNSLFHVGGVASTYALITTDSDYEVHSYFAKHTELDPYTVPAVYLGYVVPVALGGGLYFTGLASDERETIAAGSAVLQASAIAVTNTSMLKAVTGRPPPDSERQPDMRAASREFRFGLLRGGVHYGWPSGHLGVNTAAVVSLAYLFPGRWELHLAGAGYLSYMAFGVAAHEGNTMHWCSDIVAGTLMGYAIGSSVGRGFRRALGSDDVAGTDWTVSPALGADYTGLSLSVAM